jgi:hypothetical protein
MRSLVRVEFWSHAVLSLVVLTANVGAPFRTSALVRTFLGVPPHDATANAVIRVRVISSTAASLGFRAVVGVAKGGTDKGRLTTNFRLSLTFLPSATGVLPRRHATFAFRPPNPPLRC